MTALQDRSSEPHARPYNQCILRMPMERCIFWDTWEFPRAFPCDATRETSRNRSTKMSVIIVAIGPTLRVERHICTKISPYWGAQTTQIWSTNSEDSRHLSWSKCVGRPLRNDTCQVTMLLDMRSRPSSAYQKMPHEETSLPICHLHGSCMPI